MTKLYHAADGWEIPGQQQKGAERHDIPTTPIALAAWLNERQVPAIAGEAPTAQLARPFVAPGELVLGETTKDPPRVSPRFLGDVAAGADFVPVAKAAEIDRLLERCPQCHHTAEAAQRIADRLDYDGVHKWIEAKASELELDELADLIERRRA